MTAWGPFLVVILDDYRIVLRWGDVGNGSLIVNDANHRTYYAMNKDGSFVYGLGVREVYTTPRGEIVVEIEAESKGSVYKSYA